MTNWTQSAKVWMERAQAAEAELDRRAERIARMEKAGNALADAAMVCPEDVEKQREVWREACAE